MVTQYFYILALGQCARVDSVVCVLAQGFRSSMLSTPHAKSKERYLRILGGIKGAGFQNPALFTGTIVTMVTNGSVP